MHDYYAGPSFGHTVAAQVKDNGDQTFQAEFTPKMAGEHRIHVLYEGQPVPGSPFGCKVYDVTAIKVKEATKGVVGKPVTFLGILNTVNEVKLLNLRKIVPRRLAIANTNFTHIF